MSSINYLSRPSVNYLRNTKVEIPESIKEKFKEQNLKPGSIRLGITYKGKKDCMWPGKNYVLGKPPLLEGKINIYLVSHKGSSGWYKIVTSITSKKKFKANETNVLVDEAKDIGNDEKFLTEVLKEYLSIKGVVSHH